MFRIEISGGPNSSPAKSLFSTVPFHAQIAQIPNSPPTQAKFESPLVSSLSPPLCRTTTTKTTVALHHRTGATSSTPSSTAPGGPPITSAAATDVPHRHRVPPHQVRFTDAVSQLTGATSPSTSSRLRPRGRWGFTNGLVHRIVALRCHSRSASMRGQPTPTHHPQRL